MITSFTHINLFEFQKKIFKSISSISCFWRISVLCYFLISFTSCDRGKFPKTTFLENLNVSCAQGGLYWLHSNDFLNLRKYFENLNQDSIYVYYESKAHVNNNDTTDFKNYYTYTVNLKKGLLEIDSHVEDYLIEFDITSYNIKSICIDKRRLIEVVYENNKLTGLYSYSGRDKEHLNGYCVFKYKDDRIVEEVWNDVTDKETILNRKILYEYDGSKNLIAKKVYNPYDNLVWEIKYSYLDDKILVRNIMYGSEDYISTYLYDKFYNLLSMRSNEIDNVVDSVIYKPCGNKLFKIERSYIPGNIFENITRIVKYSFKDRQ